MHNEIIIKESLAHAVNQISCLQMQTHEQIEGVLDDVVNEIERWHRQLSEYQKEIKRLQAEILKLRGALELVEWVVIDEDEDPFCPHCWGYKEPVNYSNRHFGHYRDCEVGQALRRHVQKEE